MDFDNYTTMTEVLSATLIYDNPEKPLKEVSAALGMPYITLAREINPQDDGLKLKADRLLPIMQISGDIRPLKWLAHKMGYELVKREAHPDKPTWAEEHCQDSALMGALANLMESGAKPHEVQAVADKLKIEIDETVTRYTLTYGGNNG